MSLSRGRVDAGHSRMAGKARGDRPSLAMYIRKYCPMYIREVTIEMVSVAELRAELSSVLEKLQTAHRPVYVTQRGRPRAVLVALDEYNALIERLEYLDDSIEGILGEQRRRDGEKGRSVAAYMAERKRRDARVPRRATAKP